MSLAASGQVVPALPGTHAHPDAFYNHALVSLSDVYLAVQVF